MSAVRRFAKIRPSSETFRERTFPRTITIAGALRREALAG
jgi:hypothetical protein